MTVPEKLTALRKVMEENGAQWYLCNTADPHGSEYINDHYKEREYLSGFTGSAGTLLVGTETACLWTDGRYFVQAEKELDGSTICLMREGDAGVPTLYEYLADSVASGDLLLLDGRLCEAKRGQKIASVLRDNGARMRIGKNLVNAVWEDRPSDSAEDIRVLPKDLCGCSVSEKITMLRDAVAEAGGVATILSCLEEQMWLFNLRGNDVECNPVAYAYSVITDESVTLYVKEEAVTDDFYAFAEKEDIRLRSYDSFYRDLPKLRFDGSVLVDPDRTNYLIQRVLERSGAEIIAKQSPIEEEKAVKNETEIGHTRRIYRNDSLVLTRFLHYVKEKAGKEALDELALAKKLDDMRLAQPDCNDLSFTTISAFGPNAAMMHYEATEEDHAAIGANGFYLVDSGGQYDGGTTDVTRTLALGEIPREQKKQFTRVLAGMLALQNAVFLSGCGGRNLDILARGPVWELEMDYKCGTGHGVGYMLSVHEGPHGIRWKQLRAGEDAVIRPGMLVSDEPGVYVAGSHGIRIENILLCVKRCENGDGEFLAFEPLTLVPIDRDAILPEELQPKELAWLNAYHKQVRDALLPLMEDEDEKEWLIKATEALG
ncbi:MAG: aminopeptidase P family protein [Lachnospiraceae bacterium]|nr:aminopeptidase P family protein [Lachnospiraceae bacterium]